MAERFRNMQLQDELDMYDDSTDLFVELNYYVKKRSKIVEIVAAKDIIFAIAQSGLGAAFNRITSKRIAFLNSSPDEVIRSLFYNKSNDSLITVSVYAYDSSGTIMKCRTTPIEYIRRNQLDAGLPLFESESFKWPGFVDFNDVNGKVLTYSATNGIYKVFDLKNYSCLYSIPDENMQDIKMSKGTILLIYDRALSHVPLKILSIEDGKPLKSVKLWLHPNKKISFIEQFNEKLLVKQEGENLQIIDAWSSEVIEVSATKFMTSSALVFLCEKNLFFTFRNRTVVVWNLRGELVASFEDHLLWHRDFRANNIYIASDQDLIISYCKSEAVAEDGTVTPFGSINASEIMTGKCITKLAANDPALSVAVAPRGNSYSNSKRSLVQSSVSEALEDVTALFYNEETNEIYTGNSKGMVHVWSKSNRPQSICAKL